MVIMIPLYQQPALCLTLDRPKELSAKRPGNPIKEEKTLQMFQRLPKRGLHQEAEAEAGVEVGLVKNQLPTLLVSVSVLSKKT